MIEQGRAGLYRRRLLSVVREVCWVGVYSDEQDRVEQYSAGDNMPTQGIPTRASLGEGGTDTASQPRAGQGRIGHPCPGQGRAGTDRTSQPWAGKGREGRDGES